MRSRLTGYLAGVVIDEDGVPIPGVTIEISNPALMGIRVEVTTDKGSYRFSGLQPGAYKTVFSLEGFQTIGC